MKQFIAGFLACMSLQSQPASAPASEPRPVLWNASNAWTDCGGVHLDPIDPQALAASPGMGTLLKVGNTPLVTSLPWLDFELHFEIACAQGARAEISIGEAASRITLPQLEAVEWHSITLAARSGRVLKLVADGMVHLEREPAAGQTVDKTLSLTSLKGNIAVRNAQITPLGKRYSSPLLYTEKLDDSGFTTIFDGTTLSGWHASAKSGHSRTSNNKSGGNWRVEDGAIVGSQDVPGNGGVLLTDRADYHNFELAIDMRNDFGPDSGLFLRSTEDCVAYQAHVDYHNDGTLMGLYGEGMKRGFRHRAFHFLDTPTRIVPEGGTFALPFPAERWPELFDPARWNELRVRIEGQPPHLTTWINRVRILDWQDGEVRHPEKGAVGLQVHGGGDFTRQSVRYKNIRIKPLANSNR